MENGSAALSNSALDWLKRTVLHMASGGAPVSVVEFGSGKSTALLSHLKAAYQIQDMRVVSYDSSAHWAAAGSVGVDVRVRGVSTCTDEAFERMFAERRYDSSAMSPGEHLLPLDWHIRNGWYKVHPSELLLLCAYSDSESADPSLVNTPFDLVVVDGPNGNGRSLAFLAIQHCVKVGTVFFIDDHMHYDFVERLQQVFRVEKLHGSEGRREVLPDNTYCSASAALAGECVEAGIAVDDSEERFAIFRVIGIG
jgi:hypothetical protein